MLEELLNICRNVEGVEYVLDKENNYYIANAANKKITKVFIRSEIDNKPVRKIGNFIACLNLNRVKMPSSIEIIEKGAFHGCSRLDEVDFGGNVKIICDEAFYACSSLISVHLPNTLKILGKRFLLSALIWRR